MLLHITPFRVVFV